MQPLAGIELGGTKTVLVLGRPEAVAERLEFATAGPDETLARAFAQVERWRAREGVAALGIGGFGPIRVASRASDHGTTLATPKPGWTGVPVLALARQAFAGPIGLDTDVNAAALAEHRLLAGGCSSLVYMTIGTGVGGGIVVGGEAVHGRLHPEIGHVRLRRAPGDRFAGSCPFHGDCAEGLLGGPALAARFGRHPGEVPPGDEAWNAVAHDLAELLAMLMLALSPERIVVGGGVTNRQPHLLRAAIARIPAILGGYLGDCDPASLAGMVVRPQLGDNAGPVGALILAERALAGARSPIRPCT